VLRKEIKERELKEDDFTVDLYRTVNRPGGKLPFYFDPDQLFATTCATGVDGVLTIASLPFLLTRA